MDPCKGLSEDQGDIAIPNLEYALQLEEQSAEHVAFGPALRSIQLKEEEEEKLRLLRKEKETLSLLRTRGNVSSIVRYRSLSTSPTKSNGRHLRHVRHRYRRKKRHPTTDSRDGAGGFREMLNSWRDKKRKNVSIREKRSLKHAKGKSKDHLVHVKESAILDAAQKSRRRRAATARSERIWDYGVIPYEIDANFSGENKALFKLAMRHWELYTCLKFVEREPIHPNWIQFTERACGCCSFVGKRGNGAQAISIGKNCDKFGIVVHELGHVVGFWHEHTRPDRDENVRIIRENIMEGQEYNFNKQTSEEVNSLGQKYDFASIMHYATNTFSKNENLDTILPLEDPLRTILPEIGQRRRLSPGDIKQTELLYKCRTESGGNLLDPVGNFSTPKMAVILRREAALRAATENSTDNTAPPPTESEDHNQISRKKEDVEAPISKPGSDSHVPPSDEASGKHGNPPQPTHSEAENLVDTPKAPPEEGMNGPLLQGGAEQFEWRISVSHGEKIVLNISRLEMASSENCQEDFIEVRNGYWHKSPLIGRFCGTQKEPLVVSSTGNEMLVSYGTRGFHPNMPGFYATYEAVCGGRIDVHQTHLLTSPGYPREYTKRKDCVWIAVAPEEYQVALKFTFFETENHDDCRYDYLEIRDGGAPDSPLIGKFCGYKIPEDIKSTGNLLWLKFASDDSVERGGFALELMEEYDECATTIHQCDHGCVNFAGGYRCTCRVGYALHSNGKTCEDACGGVITASNGTLTSPSYPELYPGHKHCIWEIIAPSQFRITLNFTHFDLEGTNGNCEYDHVEVISKMGSDELITHGSYCGETLPPSLTSEGNAFRIEFKSDGTVQKSGFAAVFFTDKDECADRNGGCQHVCRNTIGSYECLCNQGFQLHENGHDCKEGGCKYLIKTADGVITSPNYPDHYPSKKNCVWKFVTTPGHRIKLVFSDFEMEPHQECTYDHIEIFDGPSDSERTMGRFCGTKVPAPIVGSHNELFMTFTSDSSVQRKGFRGRHGTVCGGHLSATQDVSHLYSHAKYGDETYPHDSFCEWTLEAPEGYVVRLEFLTFELEESTNCDYDFVAVFSSFDSPETLDGKFCGNAVPPPLVSDYESMLVRFVADDTLSAKGFSASYKFIPSPHPEYVYEPTEGMRWGKRMRAMKDPPDFD